MPDNDFSPALEQAAKLAARQRGIVTDEMIQAACVAGYGVGTDKDSNLYKLVRRALVAALNT